MKGNDRRLIELKRRKYTRKKAEIEALITLCHDYLFNVFLKKKIAAKDWIHRRQKKKTFFTIKLELRIEF